LNDEADMAKSKSSVSGVRQELPDGWLRPQSNMQATLFPRPTDEVLSTLGVIRGDLRRWRDLGWMSFDVDSMDQLDQPEEWEVAFVRNIACSNLSITQINEFIDGLAKPLRYDPERTAYHFEHGWVMTPRAEDPLDVVDREVEAWIESLAEAGDTDRLRDLANNIEITLEGNDSEEA